MTWITRYLTATAKLMYSDLRLNHIFAKHYAETGDKGLLP